MVRLMSRDEEEARLCMMCYNAGYYEGRAFMEQPKENSQEKHPI
jgi:hypothetical protein